MKRGIIEALEKRYEATIAEMHAEINIILNNPVGIGEHTKFIDEVDQKLQKIADSEEKSTCYNRLNSNVRFIFCRYSC